MNFFRWLFYTPPRGMQSGKDATKWASTRFPTHLQPIAAYVADLLCEQLGVTLSALEPTTNIIVDLGADELEPVEILMALEEDLAIVIPDEDCGGLATIDELVSYLHGRLSTGSRST